MVDDVVSLDRIVVFPAGKDRPVLLTALASAQVLLTLDEDDFTGFLGRHFYGLPIRAPSEFLVIALRNPVGLFQILADFYAHV